MSSAIRRSTPMALKLLAPLVTFAALFAVLSATSGDERIDPVAALGPQPAGQPAPATAEAIASLEGALRAEPGSVATYTGLGDTYLQAARESADPTYLERADAAFEAALSRDPANVLAVNGRGTVALAGHDFARGLELGQRAHQLEPGLLRPYATIFDAEIELGRYADAAQTLDRMVALKPTLAAYARVSYFRELNGDLDGAADAMRLAVAAGSGSIEGSAYVQHLLGKLEILRGRLGAAERAFTGALAVDPGYALATAGLARVAAERGEYGAAISGYREAVAGLGNAENATGLADTLHAAGREAAAARAYDRAIAIARTDPVEVNQELALLETDHGSLAKGLAAAQEAWRQSPGAKSAEAFAWALHRSGRSERALPLAARAVALHRGDPAVLYRSARVAAGAGAIERARGWFQEVVRLDPEFDPPEGPPARRLISGLG